MSLWNQLKCLYLRIVVIFRFALQYCRNNIIPTYIGQWQFENVYKFNGWLIVSWIVVISAIIFTKSLSGNDIVFSLEGTARRSKKKKNKNVKFKLFADRNRSTVNRKIDFRLASLVPNRRTTSDWNHCYQPKVLFPFEITALLITRSTSNSYLPIGIWLLK